MSKKNGLGKFLLGAGIGAGLGMLLTKRTGKENYQILKNKAQDLIKKAKEIDSEEVKNTIEEKINQIMNEVAELDKEKVIKIAKKQAAEIKNKSEELVEYVIEKGTPMLEKSATLLKEKTIVVTKQLLNKLEQEEK